MRVKASCPSCGSPVTPTDLLCANCELILDVSRIPVRRAAGDLSVVRRMFERPQPGVPNSVPVKRPAGPTRVFPRSAKGQRVPVVVASLSKKMGQLSELEAYLLSFIDGEVDVASLARKSGATQEEVSALLQGLNDKRVIDFADEPFVPSPRSAQVSDSKPQLEPLSFEPTPVTESRLAAREADEALEAMTDPARLPAPTRPTRLSTAATQPLDPLRSDERPAATAVTQPFEPLRSRDTEAPRESAPSPRLPVTERFEIPFDGHHPTPPEKPTAPMPQPPSKPVEQPIPVPQPRNDGTRFRLPSNYGRLPTPPAGVPAASPPRTAEKPVEGPTVIVGEASKGESAPRPRKRLAPHTRASAARQTPPLRLDEGRAHPPMPPKTVPLRPLEFAEKDEREPVDFGTRGDRLSAGTLQVAIRMEQSGRLDEAIELLESAISKTPDAPMLYNRLAIILMREHGDFERAEELLRRAVGLVPDNRVYRLNLESVVAKRRDSGP